MPTSHKTLKPLTGELKDVNLVINQVNSLFSKLVCWKQEKQATKQQVLLAL